MSRWDLARARSQQPARKYKVCGPVGTQITDERAREVGSLMRDPYGEPGDQTCGACAYHVCSCPRLTEFGKAFASCPPLEPTRSTIKARIDTLERFRELGMLDTPGQREAVFRMLLDGDYSGFGVKP